MNENPDTERRPRLGGETREQRSIGHAALQAVETFATGAEWTAGALAVTAGALKLTGKPGSNEDGSNSSSGYSDSKD